MATSLLIKRALVLVGASVLALAAASCDGQRRPATRVPQPSLGVGVDEEVAARAIDTAVNDRDVADLLASAGTVTEVRVSAALPSRPGELVVEAFWQPSRTVDGWPLSRWPICAIGVGSDAVVGVSVLESGDGAAVRDASPIWAGGVSCHNQ